MDPDKIIVRDRTSWWAKTHPGEPLPPLEVPKWERWIPLIVISFGVLLLAGLSLLLYALL